MGSKSSFAFWIGRFCRFHLFAEPIQFRKRNKLHKLWISKPTIYFALHADGLALAMLLLTTALTPIIIYSSFGNTYKNAKAFYALILFMTFAMTGTFLAADGFYTTSSGNYP